MKALLEKIFDEIRGAWRFRWLALLAAWALCLAGWAVVLALPDMYEAAARVFVDTRTALSRATEGLAVSTDIDSQIHRVREALMGGPELEEVMRKEGMLMAGATPRERQQLIMDLRERIRIDSRGAGLFVISFRDRERERALRIVDRLLNNFVENTLGGKREGSEQAERFLIEQIADYERRLSAAEQRLADFKKDNVGLMPGAQGDYFSRLQAEMQNVSRLEAELGVVQRRRQELQRQLRGEAPLTASVGPAAGAGSAPAPIAGAGDLGARIRETQLRLDELLLRFTEKHPDVIALRETLEELKARQEAEMAAARAGDAGAAARTGLSANPVYQSIQLQLNQTDVEIAELRGQLSDSRGRVGELQRLVDIAPDVEAEFARLNRDYDVTYAQYQSLVQRLEQARLSQQAEETGIVRFDIIDPPSAAFKPVEPNRPLLIIAVLVMGLGAGGALSYLLHQFKPVFSNPRQLNEITGLPVLGVVSMTWLEKYKAARRNEAFVYAGAAGLLMLAGGAMFLAHGRLAQILQQWSG